MKKRYHDFAKVTRRDALQLMLFSSWVALATQLATNIFFFLFALADRRERKKIIEEKEEQKMLLLCAGLFDAEKRRLKFAFQMYFLRTIFQLKICTF